MLSYRHGFHAGNHADILKHMVQCLILRSLCLKDKPFTIIDTHAGAGVYDLSSTYARKNFEFHTGYEKVKDDARLKELVPEFYSAIEAVQALATGSMSGHPLYPGSPFISSHLSRASDSIFLSDLHKSEFESLRSIFKKQRKVHVNLQNGLESLKSLLPPVKKRGLILIDPSYEMKHDYVEVVKALKEGYSRFNQGIFAIWYPVLGRLNDHSKKLIQDLKRTNLPLLQAEIRVSAQEEEHGMCGSGMLVVNYPYQLDIQLEEVVGRLYELLCDSKTGSATLSVINMQE